ncbi:MAG TPA: M20 family peptidase [Dehalococcoidia bacterium]|nr:M20 family peptidase [Dehalococcoidia bacterium]
MDTVWATDTLQEMPFRMQDGLVSGPGILDMKAGIAILLHALDALKTLGLAPQRRVKMVFNSDEEVGSTTSRALIEEEARKSAHVFVLEPAAGSGGALKIGRKGVGMSQLKVTCRAAHAGNEPEKGISAVEELAHQIIRLHSFTDLEIGTTVNVGVMSGGSVRNQIAPFAEGLVDLRVATMSEADRVTEEILALKPSLPGAVVEITGGMNRLPMEKTPATARLLESARNISEPLRKELGEAHVGGGSDAQFASAMGVAVLDGLGGVGEGPHAVHEHIIAAELPRRVGLLASLLMGT